MPASSPSQLGQRSLDELGTPLIDVTFCVVDLETTGGSRHDDAITEVGAVKVRGGECLGTLQTLVNPGRAIPPAISLLTGLTDALVVSAPYIDEVLPTVLEFLGDAVIVGHNVGFDIGFVDAALRRSGRPPLDIVRVDTAALARRLVRDEAPNCKLSTLASRLRLDHRPSHRALDDALATTDLLHLLLERAAGWGVTGLDDLLALVSLTGHPQSAKLQMTEALPRRPGVYMFCGAGEEVLYVGKATNLRQRVRSYFGRDDRRKIGSLLREARAVRHIELPDPLSAEVVEARLISRLLPRYNRQGTRSDRYCYVRLDVEASWPRLSIASRPDAPGAYLGPVTSRAVANLVIEALQTVIRLRRCTRRLGRRYEPALDASLCTSAQLGLAPCPCAGAADPAEYAIAVDLAARALGGDADHVVAELRRRMLELAVQQRFEEAAGVRDRARALSSALRRQTLLRAVVDLGHAEWSDGSTSWVVDDARLVDVRRRGELFGTITAEPPPEGPPVGAPLPARLADEALILARHLDRHIASVDLVASGQCAFPVPPVPDIADDRAPGSQAACSSEAIRCDVSTNRSSSAAARPSSIAAAARINPAGNDSA
jgi:DNA polymerase-3 subunit epsilon